MSDGVVLVAVFLLAVLIFTGLVLLFARKAGGIKELWIGAKFGTKFSLGAQMVRFDAENDRTSQPAIQPPSEREPVPALESMVHSNGPAGDHAVESTTDSGGEAEAGPSGIAVED